MKGVYQIKNIVTGKVYIGSSIEIETRWRKHRDLLNKNIHHSPYLQSSWNKHGEESFIFEVIEEIFDEKQLLTLEQKWIDIKSSFEREFGYNARKQANSPLGCEWTEERKKEQSFRMSGEKHHFYGKSLSKQHKEKISISNKGKIAWNKGKKASQEIIERLKMANIGRVRICSDETKEKIRTALAGHEVSENTKNKLKTANKGKKLSEETKKKISEASIRNNQPKLTTEQVNDIKQLKGTLSQVKIAKIYGVSQSIINKIFSEQYNGRIS
jgi:group I intron endonuclease